MPARPSRSSAGGAPGVGAGACRPSTPSPAWMPARPTRRSWPAGSRGHWSIQNGLHWVRDVVFAEDSSQVRTAHGPINLAALRTLAINALRLTGHTNIAAGLRQHARTPLLPLATLGLM